MNWYHYVLIAYLIIGGLIGIVLVIWGSGMRGYTEGTDILLGLFATVFWLPYIIWKIFKVLLMFFIPMQWQNKLGILAGKRYQ